ncbi:uncharacterized protein LOC111324550 isoform X1 [Stylophora pistillata]|uniref:uncharacterized protein LOC111324550 isoform X1 n=1 Tax=Stylophora pistillata TaxID=50429 RepID=UPI000C04A2A9|nr:uncharacterized protein LOC111324550 isoform X1 [Stylophora pistillata]
MDETTVIYYVDNEDMPYRVKLLKSPSEATLLDLKNVLNRQSYKFFFKSRDDDFGKIKVERNNEEMNLPSLNGRVVARLFTSDTKSVSDPGRDQQTVISALSGIRPPVPGTGGIEESRPPSFHPHGGHSRAGDFDSEADSVVSSERGSRWWEKHFNRNEALGGTKTPMPGQSATTPGICPKFLERHSTDAYLRGGSAACNTAAQGNEPERGSALFPLNGNSFDTKGQMRQVLDDGQVLFVQGHLCTEKKMPTEQNDTDTGYRAKGNANPGNNDGRSKSPEKRKRSLEGYNAKETANPGNNDGRSKSSEKRKRCSEGGYKAKGIANPGNNGRSKSPEKRKRSLEGYKGRETANPGKRHKKSKAPEKRKRSSEGGYKARGTANPGNNDGRSKFPEKRKRSSEGGYKAKGIANPGNNGRSKSPEKRKRSLEGYKGRETANPGKRHKKSKAPEKRKRSSEGDTLELKRYERRRDSRGKCIIVNNYDFGHYASYRDGAKHDEHGLRNLFEEHHYTVKIKRNLSKKRMERLAKEVAFEDHKNCDALFFIIMSHGSDDDTILGVDGKLISIQALMSRFKPNECPSLRDKPKVFLVQACRGPYSERYTGPMRDSSLSRGTRPQEADFLLAYASAPGYTSTRLPTGSIFIQALIEVFRKRSYKSHVDDMLTEVTNLTIERSAKEAKRYKDHLTHVPTVSKSLRFRLYL